VVGLVVEDPLERTEPGNADSWRARLEKLRTGRLFGRFFAASRQKLRQAAAHLNVRSVANLAGCPARCYDLELRIVSGTQ
jgi:hypothetical protein